MIWGMTLQTFTVVHVAISLIAIGSGIVVLLGMLGGKRLDPWTALFLLFTALTSLTGFGFPSDHVSPAQILGILSLITLAVAIPARYVFHLASGWRITYVVTAMIALYFNCFVLVVQSFEKIAFLKALAPTQSEAPFKIAQLLLLIIFIGLTIMAARRFRSAPKPVVMARAA
jgi:hypothetical protein